MDLTKIKDLKFCEDCQHFKRSLKSMYTDGHNESGYVGKLHRWNCEFGHTLGYTKVNEKPEGFVASWWCKLGNYEHNLPLILAERKRRGIRSVGENIINAVINHND